MKFWYKFVNKSLPQYFGTMFTFNFELHRIETRGQNQLHLFPTRIVSARNGVRHHIPDLMQEYSRAKTRLSLSLNMWKMLCCSWPSRRVWTAHRSMPSSLVCWVWTQGIWHVPPAMRFSSSQTLLIQRMLSPRSSALGAWSTAAEWCHRIIQS